MTALVWLGLAASAVGAPAAPANRDAAPPAVDDATPPADPDRDATPPAAASDGGAEVAPEASDAASTTAPQDRATVPGEVILVTGEPPPTPALPEHRARSQVDRDDLQRRLPRSAPDALRYEPGVFVQQTAHGQGSAFIRGMTGQQTLILFDGIRLNNSTYRQGPNQYFFTLDSQSIQWLQVLRGGASTRYGSDALGGVILAMPIEPEARSPGTSAALAATPHLILRGATADSERGGRAQVDVAAGHSLAFFGGIGGRRVGRLESGGVVHNPADGGQPQVPRFEDDDRTQLGTGFDELTGDGRLVYRVDRDNALKLAAYAYRQLDAPRTDQCPAAYAPYDECLTYDEQFRTLVYGVWESRPHHTGFENLRATLSFQRQHERRTLRRPAAEVENLGRDRVDTLGVTIAARSRELALGHGLAGRLTYGADTYHDRVASAAWIRFTDIDLTERRSRGQYLDGSRYTYGGAFTEVTADLGARLRARAGGRLSWIRARAPADPDSGSRAIARGWWPVVGSGGVELGAAPRLRLLANYDRSFRAPNLDDLTSRQQTGPGFQFENPELGAETAHTIEVGARLSGPVHAELWAFHTWLRDAVVKRPREASDCPPESEGCASSWSRFQLVNAAEGSVIRGIEAALLARLPAGLAGRASAAYTFGEGPNVGDPPTVPDPDHPFPERVPLSRVPPLNGTVELVWRRAGLTTSAGLRWAMLQDRLALADISDPRIPAGGTPGFAVLDVRISYRWEPGLLASLALENVLDAAYRYHGSSVNGPGRGLVFLLDLAPP